jgi:LPXTG-motif cell wall-anchored protein
MRLNTKDRLLRIAAVGLVGLGTGFLTASARADQWDKKTILTVNEPIQVRETVLQPGKYVFKLMDSQSDRHIVQIFNYDQSRIIDTQLAIPNYRLQPTGDSRFAFWETPEGSTRALRAWFYPGDNFGQEFPYPKHLAMARTSTATVTYHAAEPEPATAPVAEPETAAAEPAPQAPPPEPTVTAQNAPPPASAPPPPAQTESTLPKTATSYPLIGLAGLLSLGCFAFLRRKSSVEN